MRPVLLLAVLALVAGCGGEPAAKPAPTPTSLAQLEPATMNLVRVAFCDLVPTQAVTAAVGGRAGDPQQWASGDRVPGGAAGDLAHEAGCSWTRGRDLARAWVFARPVDAALGRAVVAQARARKGCTTTPSTTFGKPGLLQQCRSGAVTRVRHAGLFGDTWLTCEVAGPERPAAVGRRADAWCLAVAGTLDRTD